MTSPPTRIVHLTTVHHALDPRIFHKEAVSLREAGYDVHLVAPHPASETRRGVHIHALPPRRGRAVRLALQRPLYQTARRLKADLYHFHDPELIPLARALKASGARVVYDVHEDYLLRGGPAARPLRALERWCFGWVDAVVLAADCLASVVEGSDVRRAYVLNYFRPPAEDAASTAAPGDEAPGASSRRLLYAGVQSRSRGLGVLLDLAGLIRAEELPWTIDLVGVCYVEADRRWAERRIASEELSGVVHRTGWDRYIPWTQMTPYFRSADVGLALIEPRPAYARTIPTKFYEYLHYGLPILCSDVPGWRAFVERHGCGAPVDPFDARAALAVLRDWDEDDARRRALADAARRAAPHYAWSTMAERLVLLYADLLA